MSHLHPIYDVWGGNAEAMATDIAERGVTVRQWRNRGDIPSRAWPKIIKAAAAKGTIIPLEAFLSREVQAELPVHTDDHNASDTLNQNLSAEADSHRPFCSTSSTTLASGLTPAESRTFPCSASERSPDSTTSSAPPSAPPSSAESPASSRGTTDEEPLMAAPCRQPRAASK